jgi:hypothetical protein
MKGQDTQGQTQNLAGSRNFSQYHSSLGHSNSNRSLGHYGSQTNLRIEKDSAQTSTKKKSIVLIGKQLTSSKIFMSTHEKMLHQKRLVKNSENPVAMMIS